MSKKTCPVCGELFHPKGYSNHRRHCDDGEKANLRRMYWEENMSTNQIGEVLGVSGVAVLKKMQKYGIDTRTPGEGKRLRHQHDVQTYWNHGRLWIRVKEYENQYAVSAARATLMADNSLEEMEGMDTHHKNDHPADDRPSNLALLDHAEHSSLTNS